MKLPMNIILCVDEPGHFGAVVRGLWPLYALVEAEVARLACHSWPGPKVDDTDQEALEKFLEETESGKKIEFPKQLIRDVAGADVIVLPQTACTAWYGQIRYWQSLGKVVVADADDDSFNVHPTSPSYGVRGEMECDFKDAKGNVLVRWRDRAHYPKDVDAMALAKESPPTLLMNLEYNKRGMARYRQALAQVDAITTTTERARKRFLDFNPNVFVLPNSIDTGYYIPGRHPGREGFRILWYGGNSHESDLVNAGKGLGRFLNEHPGAVAVVAGSICETLLRHLPNEQRELWDWTSAEAHPWRLMGLGADMGFCAVKPGSAFNACKSALKWTEMGAIGVPAICTNAPPYSDAVRDGEDGLLVDDTPDAWYAAFCRMHDDRVLRERIAKGARARMVAEFDLYANAGKWFEAYRGLVEARAASRIEVPGKVG